jgi:DMSO/TMAO reductase YedYZ molybdopterin-dependent catalytic subunit
VPAGLADTPLRELTDLPLLADGSAPEHPNRAAGVVKGPKIWRYTKGEPPPIEFDYHKLAVKVDARGTAKRSGTLTFSDLEALPRELYVTLLQCGAPVPSGIVKWVGVRFADVAEMLGVQGAAYCRVVGSDRYWVDEDMTTMMHPQVMLAWMMNDEPISPEHGAPLRLVIPFRYGARSVKAVSEIILTATAFGLPEFPDA